jgi:cytochrome c6
MRTPAMRTAVATIVLIGALAFGAGCGSKSQPNVAPQPKGKQASDKELVEGRSIFVANCQRCHGPRGQGGAGPKLAGVVTNAFPNIQNQINVVTNGVGAMPAWKGTLTAAQIKAVVRYTREVL